MKLLIISLFIFTHAQAYLSYGDASDDCSFTSTQTLTKSVWNCDDLVVSAGAVMGKTPSGILDPARASSTSELTSDIEAACTYKEEADFQLLNSLFAFLFSIILLRFGPIKLKLK